MNEQAIIEKVNKIVSEIRKEYTEYKGQYYLLTHVINLEFLMGKYFALMEILLDNIGENPLILLTMRIVQSTKRTELLLKP